MKIIKCIVSFILLVLIGAFISYADMKFINDKDKLIEVFNNTSADFKFYNIKANAAIEYDLPKEEMVYIFMEIIESIGLEEADIRWDDTENQMLLQAQTDEKSISIAGTKKSEEEAYIIVDIMDNKVYKNIVDDYDIIENVLKEYATQLDMYECIAGEYIQSQINKYDDILDKILYNMNAEEIDRVEDNNFISVTAYSNLLNKNDLEYLGNKINLNIGFRYSEDEEKTTLYMATPIIKLDY
jgi:hypothetical protein